MKRFYGLTGVTALLASFMACAKTDTPTIQYLPVEHYPVKFSGYIKHEAYWDTRQNNAIQDYEFLFYPLPYLPDINGRDINAHGQFDMVPIQSRLRAEMIGPQIKNADSLGVAEIDLFGKSVATVPLTSELHGLLRIRHVFAQLTWDKTAELLLGQTWHPMFVVGCEPRTISNNAGAPLTAYVRNPQVRFTYLKFAPFELILTAFTQMDSKSLGPLGTNTLYLRDAIVPMLDGKIQVRCGNFFFGGADIQYKRIVPRLVTNDNIKTNSALNSLYGSVYAAFSWKHYLLRNQIVYTQNGYDITFWGGYAVHSINPMTDRQTYTNINIVSAWSDMDFTKYEHVTPGLFIGGGKNLGSHRTIIQNIPGEATVFGSGTNIDYMFRISPRCRWTIKNFEVDAEIEYTRAAYGTLTDCAKVVNTTAVGNTRFLFSIFYYI